MKKLTKSQWEHLDAAYSALLDATDLYGSANGEHYTLMAALNSMGHYPHTKDEAMELGERLLAQGFQ